MPLLVVIVIIALLASNAYAAGAVLLLAAAIGLWLWRIHVNAAHEERLAVIRRDIVACLEHAEKLRRDITGVSGGELDKALDEEVKRVMRRYSA